MDKVRPIVVIGAGPAGLMAAEQARAHGRDVEIFDAMPTPGRKFLRAGIGGLNLTHSEPLPRFISRYGTRQGLFAPWLAEFGPDQQRQWAADLGVETFVGSSGRVFPTAFKGAPMLRAWLRRLDAQGIRLHLRHRWAGWDETGAFCFEAPSGPHRVQAAAAVLALGGVSWPKLGSNGGWTQALEQTGAEIAPWRPANCGFNVAWSDLFRDRFAGQPVKSVGLSLGDRHLKGEFVITRNGIEGSAIYALSAAIRDAGAATPLLLDLKPDWSLEKLTAALARPRGSRSLARHLERTANIKDVTAGLLRELAKPLPESASDLARSIKSLPLFVTSPRPVSEAISSAGGVRFECLDESLMLISRPGVFLAGEMLDWEAPTGGYLLTGCLATGRLAGKAAAKWADRIIPRS